MNLGLLHGLLLSECWCHFNLGVSHVGRSSDALRARHCTVCSPVDGGEYGNNVHRRHGEFFLRVEQYE